MGIFSKKKEDKSQLDKNMSGISLGYDTYYCPICNEPKMTYNVAKHMFICWNCTYTHIRNNIDESIYKVAPMNSDLYLSKGADIRKMK